MTTTPDHPDHGFQFPGVFEITAMGPASAGLEERIPEVLEAVGIVVLRETVAARNSSGGKFVSIRLSFHAEDRSRYEAAHAALRTVPEIKWTL
jgi:uncharacterized protein